MGPLEGLKILDLTSSIGGAVCTMLLSDMGAEVIRLEKPEGDFLSNYGPKVNGRSIVEMTLNRGKKSVFMSLYDEQQKALFLKMAENADAVIADCMLSELYALGCGYETLKAANAKIVLTCLTPFGQSGPLSGRAADETTLQAMSGVMSMVGDFGGEPVRVGTEVAETTGAYYAFIGTMAAILEAEKTGIGQVVDVAELDAMYTMGEAPVIRHDMAGMVPALCGNRHPSTVPVGDYTCKDGKQLVVNITTDEQFANFANATESPELIAGDLKFAAERVNHREEAEEMISAAFAKFDRAEIMKRFDAANLPYGVINDAASITEDEENRGRHMVATVTAADGTVLKAVASPIKMTGMEEKTAYETPLYGCDSVRIAAEYIGIDAAEKLYANVSGSPEGFGAFEVQ
ncbi:MAG: CoA transferase [Lachnospiraceae bacterium]|nr:CoA transferase [Lachnospiraceae bacterium]